MTFKKLILMSLIAVSIAGCGTNPWAKDDCDWVQPINPSREDVLTQGTKQQITAHNEAGEANCGWKPPKK